MRAPFTETSDRVHALHARSQRHMHYTCSACLQDTAHSASEACGSMPRRTAPRGAPGTVIDGFDSAAQPMIVKPTPAPPPYRIARRHCSSA